MTAIWIHILNGCRASFASGAFVFSDCSRLTSERLTAALWQGSSLAWSTNGYPHGLDLRRLRHTNPKKEQEKDPAPDGGRVQSIGR